MKNCFPTQDSNSRPFCFPGQRSNQWTVGSSELPSTSSPIDTVFSSLRGCVRLTPAQFASRCIRHWNFIQHGVRVLRRRTFFLLTDVLFQLIKCYIHLNSLNMCIWILTNFSPANLMLNTISVQLHLDANCLGAKWRHPRIEDKYRVYEQTSAPRFCTPDSSLVRGLAWTADENCMKTGLYVIRIHIITISYHLHQLLDAHAWKVKGDFIVCSAQSLITPCYICHL